MLPDDLKDLIDYDPQNMKVHSREGRRMEFKLNYDNKQVAAYERTLAALANTLGGTIIFGVSDKPRIIVGVDPDMLPDDAKLTDLLRLDFAPEIPFESRLYQVGSLTLYAISVNPPLNRPIISKRSRTKIIKDGNGNNPKEEEVIREATIYYRYTAQTKAIAYTELRHLMDEQEERKLKVIMQTLKAVERVGYEKVGIVDATTFNDPKKATNLYISKETAQSMNFIDKGRLTDSSDEGSPAYIVIGNVSLSEVVHAPMDDADKNLPTEVCKQLRPLIAELYGDQTKLSASVIVKLLSIFGLMEMPYHEYDAKVGRRYITREGIRQLKTKIRANPLLAIQNFSSREKIKSYKERGDNGRSPGDSG